MTDPLLVEGKEGGGIEAYAGAEQTSYGGSKRRKRGKRNSRKNSRRGSKKYMKKMYRGGEVEPASEPGVETIPGSDEQGGGRRRRKGKMQKGKTRKGKVSKWITHVKNFSRANKMDFRDALKDPKCKASYHKMK
jgi:hypothetical protein